MEFENSSEDAPAQGNNGSPLTPDEDLGLISLLSPPSKDALRAFLQHGRTSKEEAASLFKFCHSSGFSWFDDEGKTNDNHNNNAATRQMESGDSTHMSASSSSSSQNPPTQPQTPTFTHNSSIGLEYYLPEDHLPDHDGVGLETFLRWLLGSKTRPVPQEKVKKLYDMSRLPGHGTDEGFQKLIDAANSASKESDPVAPMSSPMMAEFRSPTAVGFLAAEHRAGFAQNSFSPSCEHSQSTQLGQNSQPNSFSNKAQIDHSGQFLPSSHSGASMPSPSMPITVQQVSVQQFIAPAALDLSQRMKGNHGMVSPVAANQRSDSGHGNSATLSSARASPLEPPHIMASHSSPQQSNGLQIISQTSPGLFESEVSPVGDSGNKIKLTCPMSKECEKSVESDNETNAYKYLIEHIRRVHPDHHIPHLPSTKESVDKMINVEVAVCTLTVNGVPCDFRLAGQKGSRSPWRQALNHIRDVHPEKYHPGLAANKNSFVSKHARRSHPDQYIKTPSSSKEGWLAILRHNGISTSAMQRSVSDGTSSSGHSSNSPAVQRQSPQRQLPATSTTLSAQTPTIASGGAQVPVSQIQGSASISAEGDQVMSPGGPRQFVQPYMLQHEVDAMAIYQQNGHADPMTFEGQPGFVQAPFSAEYGSQNLTHDAHGRQMSIDGALRPSFGDSIQPSQLDPTLGRLLFPSLSDNIAELQTQFTHAHLSQHNGYQQSQNAHAQAVQTQAYSSPGAESSHKKRGRDDTDDCQAGSQEPPSKRVSALPQPATAGSAAPQTPNGLSVPGGIVGPIPSLTNEWFGFSLEKLAGNHFSILIGATIRSMTAKLVEELSNKFHEELVQRWPSAEQLADVPSADIMEKMKDVGLELEPAEAVQLCNSLQTLAKEYVKMPPTKDRRFGCSRYPQGAVHNVTDGEAFEAEDKGLANEIHALNASWEIAHITQQHFVLDAWRIFGRDVLLGRARDWKGTGAAPGFEPEWKRVKPVDSSLRTFIGWLWMKEGVFWDPRTDAKQPLPELVRLVANQGRVHFHTDGQFYLKTSENPEAYELIDASGILPGMAQVVGSSASNGFTIDPPSFNGLTQDTAPLVDSAEDSTFPDNFPVPIDGPDTHAGLSAFDGSMFDGGDGMLNGNWGQFFE
ncbi:hypothetical protein N0V82_010427 [Gnomoniopsis sp. IMI 355080]|nr:hypothetical protein N0V82_010427 [Gnomoniopsis sp. IMI 355080]